MTKGTLINLLSTATYGSCWLEIYSLDYKSDIVADSLEDRWAQMLLAGDTIYAVDHYAEGYLYSEDGKLDEEENGIYPLTLDKIETMLEMAGQSPSNLKDYYIELMTYSHRFDYWAANALMQYILFGQVIYG